MDLKLVPSYGEAKAGEEAFLLSGPAQEGTIPFFGYTSRYVSKKDKRFTLGLTVVRCQEGLVPFLDRLLVRFFRLGGKLLWLYIWIASATR